MRDAGVEQMQVAQVHPVGKGAQALAGGGEGGHPRCKQIGEGKGLQMEPHKLERERGHRYR